MVSRKAKRVNYSRSVAIQLTCGSSAIAATGDVKAKPKPAASHTGKIADWEKFRAVVREHGDKTQAQMAELWEGRSSERTSSRALQKIGFTRKKKRMGLANQMKPNERHS